MVEGVLQTRLWAQGNVFSAFLGLHPCRPQKRDLLTLAKLTTHVLRVPVDCLAEFLSNMSLDYYSHYGAHTCSPLYPLLQRGLSSLQTLRSYLVEGGSAFWGLQKFLVTAPRGNHFYISTKLDF